MPKSEEMISVLVNLHCRQQTVEGGEKVKLKHLYIPFPIYLNGCGTTMNPTFHIVET